LPATAAGRLWLPADASADLTNLARRALLPARAVDGFYVQSAATTNLT
jgi:hypothetical protein